MRRALLFGLLVAALAAAPAEGAGPIVSAFYYPWFMTNVEDGSYAHWAQDGHLPPNDISSVYYPSLGVYSSDDPGVLDAQMAEIQRAGINQIAVSWWGKGSPEDLRLPGVIQAATARHIDVAVQIEPYTGRSVASAVSDIDYLGTLGVRTFYIYQAFLIAPSAWAQANDALHAEGITTFAADRVRRAGSRRPLQRPLHLRHRHVERGQVPSDLRGGAQARSALRAVRRTGLRRAPRDRRPDREVTTGRSHI